MLETAQKKLKSALKKGDPWETGWAHLEVAHAIFQRSTDWPDFQEDSKEALSQADQAITAFTDIPFPGGIAEGHLARASIFTLLADGEEDELKKAGWVDRALIACLAAQDTLNTKAVHNGQIFDIFSSVSVLLIRLRGMIDQQEFQDHMDELITANGSLLGELVAADITIQDEGKAMLLTAEMLGALAELEEDPEQQREILETISMLALAAGQWVETASDPELMNQALKLHQQTQDKLGLGGEPIKEFMDEPLPCPKCKNTNPPGAKFCIECGSQLRVKSEGL